MPDPSRVIDAIAAAVQAAPAQSAAPLTTRTLLYAVVTGTDGSGRPLLRFEGETTATIVGWARLAAYTPATNDRVAVLPDYPGARSGLVLGKVA